MSIKKIGLRISTVNLERQLLHGLLQNKFNLQRTLGKHKADYFTSESRRFIYEIVNRYFNDKRVTLSKENFDYELQKRFDPISQKSISEEYSDEFNIIKGTALNDNIELVIEKLDEVQLAQNVDQLIKEAYSKLENGNYQDAANLLRQKSIDLKDTQKEGRIINLHCDSDDWFEEVQRRHDHPEIFTGIPTGFEKFDKMTGGLFPAELTIVFGLSGKGKSTFMKALTTNIRKQGKVVLHCGNEENEFQMRTKYMSADSGEKYSVFKRGNYTDEEYNRLKIFSDNARGVGAIYIYEFPQQTDTTWIERAYRQLEMQGVKVDAIVIDYLDLMKPIQQAYSENDEQGKVTSDLKQLAINCNCPVITATQAGTSSEKQEKKARPFLTSADVFGTKRKVHSANTLIGIVNQTATVGVGEEGVDRNKHRMVLCVPKNRDGAVFTFRQIMDVTCGKFYEDTDDDDPVMKNLEKQASEMIDETLPPDKIRSEIDEKEIVKAQEQSLLERLQRVQKNIEEDEEKQSQEDPFFDDAPQVIPTVEEIAVIEEDPFLNDVSEQTQEETKNVEVKEESKFSFLRKKKHQ